jgi:hypothetical protein
MRNAARLLLTAWLLIVGPVVSPLGASVALAHPTADFGWAPKPVVAGKTVTLESTSVPHDALTPIMTFEWDLGGKASCAPFPPVSTTCTTTAPGPGDWSVGLRVVDSAGEESLVTKTIPVQALPPANQPPQAAFAALPVSPVVGEAVTFVSYSQDRDGTIARQAWDLDGNGTFGDASGPIATRSFAAAGQKTIALRVTDNSGATSIESLTIAVRNAGTAAPGTSPTRGQRRGSVPPPRLLSPFPVVRLAGSVAEQGTSIDLLTVRAPRGSRVLLRCRGEDCPLERVARVVRRPTLRLKAAEQMMPAGVVLEVLVRRDNRIGKFTRFKFRDQRRPRRVDGCLWPGTAQMAPCPRS